VVLSSHLEPVPEERTGRCTILLRVLDSCHRQSWKWDPRKISMERAFGIEGLVEVTRLGVKAYLDLEENLGGNVASDLR
jgi:hypothetical protein